MIQTIDIKVKECCEFGYNLSKKSDWSTDRTALCTVSDPEVVE